MKERKLKSFVKPMGYALGVAGLLLSFSFIQTTGEMGVNGIDENYEYVNSSIITNNMPVISQNEAIVIKPYVLDKVQIAKYFYDPKATDEEKQNALIYYNDTYIQNSGILYKSSEAFDIVNILDGTVIDVKKDEFLGNVVEIKHSNNIISTYQGLSEVYVKKDQLLNQGEVIGKSGKLELGETFDNALLFELIKDGKYVNPLNYFDKKVNEL